MLASSSDVGEWSLGAQVPGTSVHDVWLHPCAHIAVMEGRWSSAAQQLSTMQGRGAGLDRSQRCVTAARTQKQAVLAVLQVFGPTHLHGGATL